MKMVNRNFIKRIAFVNVLIFCAGFIVASDYKPIIRYDRIWENSSYDFERDIVKCLRFDGTEEIEGKTYHKLVAFKKAIRRYDRDLGKYVFSTPEDVYQPEGYMREENGLVFTLVSQNAKYQTGALYLSPDDLKEGDTLAEELIYNFNVTDEGELFDMYSFTQRDGMPARFRVYSTDLVKIDGVDCRKISFDPVYESHNSSHYGGQYSMIEGIGVSYYGCLNYTEVFDHPTKIWYYNYLSRVFDIDGNVIYKSYEVLDDFDDLCYGKFSGIDEMEEKSNIYISRENVSFGEGNKHNSICIYNLNGEIIKKEAGTDEVRISTSELSAGVYLISAVSDGKCISNCKFIK